MASYIYKSTITFFNMTMLRQEDNLNSRFLLSKGESSRVYNKLLMTLKYMTGTYSVNSIPCLITSNFCTKYSPLSPCSKKTNDYLMSNVMKSNFLLPGSSLISTVILHPNFLL